MKSAKTEYRKTEHFFQSDRLCGAARHRAAASREPSAESGDRRDRVEPLARDRAFPWIPPPHHTLAEPRAPSPSPAGLDCSHSQSLIMKTKKHSTRARTTSAIRFKAVRSAPWTTIRSCETLCICVLASAALPPAKRVRTAWRRKAARREVHLGCHPLEGI